MMHEKMKKYGWLKKAACMLLCALLGAAAAGCSKTAAYTNVPQANAGQTAVVSFNVAAPWGSAWKGTGSSVRVQRFAAYMNAVRPASIGTQEMNAAWLEKLETLMPDYASYGVIRGGDANARKSEMNAVFWLKEAYDCIDKGTFWLSETPEQESKYAGAGCYRVCSYVVLQEKAGAGMYIHINTHLDNLSEQAANYGAQVIMTRAQALRDKYPQAALVLTGDFNETPGMQAYETAAAQLHDAQVIARETEKTGTYTDWGKLDDTEPIDYIFTSADRVARYTVLRDLSAGYVSDHYGIYAEIEL